MFSNLASAATNEALQAIELEMAPRLSAHWSAIYHARRFCSRGMDAVYRERDALGLDAEALRVLERYHLDFVRAGAQLNGESRDRLACHRPAAGQCSAPNSPRMCWAMRRTAILSAERKPDGRHSARDAATPPRPRRPRLAWMRLSP